MSEIITVEIPDELAEQLRAVATATRRPVEDVMVDWIRQSANNLDVDGLSEDDLLALCGSEMQSTEQTELGDLLARNREGTLDDASRTRLDQLMLVYRNGLILKARAIRSAVARGLRPPLSEDAA